MDEILKHINDRISFFTYNKKFRDDAEGCLCELRTIKRMINKKIKEGM